MKSCRARLLIESLAVVLCAQTCLVQQAAATTLPQPTATATTAPAVATETVGKDFRCFDFNGTFVLGLADVFTSSVGYFLGSAAGGNHRVLQNDLLLLPLAANDSTVAVGRSSLERFCSNSADGDRSLNAMNEGLPFVCPAIRGYTVIVAQFLSAHVLELAQTFPLAKFLLLNVEVESWWELASSKVNDTARYMSPGPLPPTFGALLRHTIATTVPDYATWVHRYQKFQHYVRSVVEPKRLNIANVRVGDLRPQYYARDLPASQSIDSEPLSMLAGAVAKPVIDGNGNEVREFNVSSSALGYVPERFLVNGPVDGIAGVGPACHEPPAGSNFTPRVAWVVLIDGFGSLPPSNLSALVMAAGVTAASIRNTGSVGELVALIQPNLPHVYRVLLRQHGYKLHAVGPLSAAATWKLQLNDGATEFDPKLRAVYLKKMHAVALTEYSRVIFIDVDIVLTKNIDFFFHLKHGETFPLTWRSWWLQRNFTSKAKFPFSAEFTGIKGYYSPINAGFWVVSPSCVDYNAIVDTFADGFDQPVASKNESPVQPGAPCTPAGCSTGLGWGAFGAQNFCGSLHCGMGCWHARTTTAESSGANTTAEPTNGVDQFFIRGYNFTNCTAAPGASHDWGFHGASADQGLLLSHFILRRRRSHTVLPMTTFQRLGLLHFAGGRKPWLLPCFRAKTLYDAKLCVNRTRAAWPPNDYIFWYALQDQVHDRLGRKQSALAQEYRTLADGVAGQTTLAAAADEDKPSIASEVATNKHPIRRRRESSAKSKLRQRLQQRRKHTVCTSDLTADPFARRDVDDVHVRACEEVQPDFTRKHIERWCSLPRPDCLVSGAAVSSEKMPEQRSSAAWVFFLDPSNPELVVRENGGDFPEEKGVDGVLTWPSWQSQVDALRVSLASLQEVGTQLDVIVMVPNGLVSIELQLDIQRLGGQVWSVDDFGLFPGVKLENNASVSAERKQIVRQVWGNRWSGRAAISRRQLHLLRLTQYHRVAYVSHQLYFTKNLDEKVLVPGARDDSKVCVFLASRKTPVFDGLFVVKPSCDLFHRAWERVRLEGPAFAAGNRTWGGVAEFSANSTTSTKTWAWTFPGASGSAGVLYSLLMQQTVVGNASLNDMCSVTGSVGEVMKAWGLVWFGLTGTKHLPAPWTMPVSERRRHIDTALRWSIRHWWELHETVERFLQLYRNFSLKRLKLDLDTSAAPPTNVIEEPSLFPVGGVGAGAFNKSDLKIFAVGLSKTATTSLCSAFRRLGYRSIHYDRAFVPHLHHWTLQDKDTRNQLVGKSEDSKWCDSLKRATGPGTGLPGYDFNNHYDMWDAVCDLPTAYFVPQLLQAYPDALFVLTERAETSWLMSFRAHTRRFDQRWGGAMPFRQRCLHELVYGVHDTSNASLWVERYRRHNADVRSLIPPSQLLIMNVVDDGDGFGELCAFLNRTDGPCEIGPITGSPELFPTANVAQQQLEQKETPWRDNSVSVLNFDRCEENRQMSRLFQDWLHANPPPPEGQLDMRWPPLAEPIASTVGQESVDAIAQFRFAWVLLLDDPSSAFWMQYTMATLVTIRSIWATNTKAEVVCGFFIVYEVGVLDDNRSWLG
eukprot:INCI5091.10.p1 GENE.INCI5091.10~~INCI5091.10.p1  ORF type:complete len:1585 (-),score=224.86 INCI5091.10:1489-6243(-)